MRSGTTSLARYLGEHPDVFVPPRKEIRYFDVPSNARIEWYAAHFKEAIRESAIGEATPNYMYEPQAIHRIADLLPSARLIAILRDPATRAYSHYWMNRALRREPLEFLEAIEKEEARLARAPRRDRLWYSYVDQGRYLRQLQHVCKFFPRDQLHIMLFEDLRDVPNTSYAAVCRFLGVRDDFAPLLLGRKINKYQGFRSLAVRRFVNTLLPMRSRPWQVISGSIGTMNRRSGEYPPMSAEERAVLVDLFRNENEALADWLRRELSLWDSSARHS